MNSGSTIRLLVIADGPEEAEHVTSLMRGAGYAVRPVRVDEGDPLRDAIARDTFDVCLHVVSAIDLALRDTVTAIRERELDVPVIAYGEGDLTAGRALTDGAADRVADDDEHLRHVLVREFGRVLTQRRAHYLEDVYSESEKRARALMETSRDAIAYIHGGMHVLANDAYLTRFGYKVFEELEGMPMIDMVTADDQTKLKEFLREYSSGEEAVGTLKLHLQQTDGTAFEAEMEFSRASIEGEACSQIIIRDRGNTAELERQLNQLSRRDSVTGLYNRQYFMEILQRALTSAENGRGQSALLQLALDEFESIKASVGVLGSDRVIADIATVMNEAAGKKNVLGRLDGATYGIVTPSADTDALDALATRVRRAIKDHICDVEGTSISVTATIGIARIDGGTSNPNDVLSYAERALAEAMDKGPDAHRIYQPKAGELSQKQIDQQWTDRIRAMLKENRLDLMYQPIVSLAGDDKARYEVLVHALDEQGQPVDDPELMAAAERTGMSKGLDRWVVLNALKALIGQLKHDRNAVFFVPLSGTAFDDPGLFHWLHERVKAIRLPKDRLVFQIDAAAATTRIKQAGAFATAARKIGCGIALSGFGHGSDPFQLTHHVSVDYLKVQEDFTLDLASNEQNQEAIKRIASEASSLGVQSICPGVRDAGTLTVLYTLGTDMIEGEFLQEATHECSYDFAAMAM